ESKALTNGRISTISAASPSPLPPAEQPVKNSSTMTRVSAVRRKVNRILIRKHLHQRYNRPIVPHLMLIALIIVIVLFSLLSTGAGAAYAYYQQQLPLLNGIADHSLFQSTHIYDRNGQLLYELYDHQNDHGRRTYVNYSDISSLLINASIAAEDHTFWQNSGVDVPGTLRAAVTNIASQTVVEGGNAVQKGELLLVVGIGGTGTG